MASPIDGHAKTLDHPAANQQPTTDMRREDRYPEREMTAAMHLS